MAGLSSLLFIVLVFVTFSSVSSKSVTYNVTFVSCTPGSNCPLGNPAGFNRTFALNGMISPNISLNVGDRLEFDLFTNVSIHPLAICQNISAPNFCLGANGTNLLNTPITVAGKNTSVNFANVGVYYYGCQNHPGMGASIFVTSKGEHQLSAYFTFITVFILYTINFIF